MYLVKEFEFDASEIAHITEATLVGEDIKVTTLKNLNDPIEDGSMILCYPKFKDRLHQIKKRCLVFCTEETLVNNPVLSFIICDNPKFSFFDFINNYITMETSYWIEKNISLTSDIYPDVTFGYNVKIGKNVVIAPKTHIGSNTIIGNNVVIRSNTIIGDNVLIKDNSVIGSEGFGFVKSDQEIIHVPQLGFIHIGDDTIIGSCCTIEKPALGSTIIEEGVKIDDLVQIGHNQHIGANTMIATGFKGIGGCSIGKNCFIGMGVTVVSKKATIGNNCFVGAGTILTKPVPDNKTVYHKVELTFTDNTQLEQMLSTPKPSIKD